MRSGLGRFYSFHYTWFWPTCPQVQIPSEPHMDGSGWPSEWNDYAVDFSLFLLFIFSYFQWSCLLAWSSKFWGFAMCEHTPVLWLKSSRPASEQSLPAQWQRKIILNFTFEDWNYLPIFDYRHHYHLRIFSLLWIATF
jgi:hypothetical protein